MLRAAIVEKSKEHREYIRAGLMGANLDIQVSEFTNEYDYLENLNEDASSFDILILNTTIRHEGDGLKLAANIRARNRKVMICFITDSQRYYAEAFSVFATGYLLYPFDVSELHNCITFFWQKPNMERRASLMLKEAGGSYRRVYCRNILYVESANRKVILHMEDGESMESYAKLDELEQQLPGKLFFRCHQSYIISMYFVEKMDASKFVVQSHEIPISRKYQRAAREVYYDYMFEKM
ncbi:LytR/AlgR family response regulator transcription factor [Blautia sp. Sow4_E7]|uniref:LytR/AlgR family response regulator transcription factor n=1 Tax=Blautia sp. Sow4_E7 TaxID=3438749 RepID=UPI003F937E72